MITAAEILAKYGATQSIADYKFQTFQPHDVIAAMEEYAKSKVIDFIRFVREEGMAEMLLTRRAILENGKVATGEDLYKMYETL